MSALCQKLHRGCLFDHIISTQQEIATYCKTERFCSFQIYNQFEFRRQLDREIGRPRTSEYPIDVIGRATDQIEPASP